MLFSYVVCVCDLSVTHLFRGAVICLVPSRSKVRVGDKECPRCFCSCSVRAFAFCARVIQTIGWYAAHGYGFALSVVSVEGPCRRVADAIAARH